MVAKRILIRHVQRGKGRRQPAGELTRAKSQERAAWHRPGGLSKAIDKEESHSRFACKQLAAEADMGIKGCCT